MVRKMQLVVALALLAGLLLSPKLWISTRLWPLVPLFDWAPAIPFPFDYVAFAALLVTVCGIIFSWHRAWTIAFLIIAAILVLLDQSRLQPWFYQYFCMLAVLGLFPPKTRLDSCRLIIACIYFYSGLQKLNPVFVGEVFPWFIQPIAPWLAVAAPAVPFLEMGIGVGLLIRILRPYAVVMALLQTLTILLALGPFGHNWNSVVWPWDMAMAVFVILLFWKEEIKIFSPSKIVVALFGILPLLSFFNFWDSYLSFSLYSGNTNNATIYLSSGAEAKLPPAVRAYTKKTGDRYALSLFDWSIGEMNVSPYPEVRVFRRVAKEVQRATGEASLEVKERPSMKIIIGRGSYTARG